MAERATPTMPTSTPSSTSRALAVGQALGTGGALRTGGCARSRRRARAQPCARDRRHARRRQVCSGPARRRARGRQARSGSRAGWSRCTAVLGDAACWAKAGSRRWRECGRCDRVELCTVGALSARRAGRRGRARAVPRWMPGASRSCHEAECPAGYRYQRQCVARVKAAWRGRYSWSRPTPALTSSGWRLEMLTTAGATRPRSGHRRRSGPEPRCGGRVDPQEPADRRTVTAVVDPPPRTRHGVSMSTMPGKFRARLEHDG